MSEEQLRECFCTAFDIDTAFDVELNAEGYDYQFSKKFDDFMANTIKVSERTYVSVGRHRVRMAVVVALITALLMATLASVSAIRRPIVSWFTKEYDKYGVVDVTFDVDDEDESEKEFQYIKPAVPDDYKIVREDKQGEAEQYYAEYQNSEGKTIVYVQSGDIENMNIYIDNEDNDLTKIKINGCEGYSASKYGNNSLYWSDGTYFFNLMGTCDMAELKKIAKSIY